MKPSRYNVFFEHNGKDFAFNSMSCALAEISSDFKNIMESLKTLDESVLNKDTKSLVASMKDGNYIIEDDVDELDILKFRSFNGKFSKDVLALTILPNFSCNFACPYCYESKSQDDKTMRTINNEVKNAIYQQIKNSAKMKRGIGVAWYGGEPTLSKDIIIEMSKKIVNICKKYDVDYIFSMTSNGYLIDDDFVKAMAKLKLKTVQITIDGPPEIHNLTRKLKNGAGTFDTIVKNIKKLVNNNITVYIRVNITKNNMDYFNELLDVLEKNGLEKCQVVPSAVVPYKNIGCNISASCLSPKEFSKKLLEYRDMMVKRNLPVPNYPYLPKLLQNYCYADNVNSYTIDPDGNLYKCWIDVGVAERSLGNIKDFSERDLSTAAEKGSFYMFWSPFKHKKCKECEILPMCMGGCPHRGILNNNNPSCDLLKYSLVDALKVHCK